MDGTKAVIFDMDGVIIDSEYIWKQAEREVFSSVGVTLSDELCSVTESMTTQEVTRFWFERSPWTDKSMEEVENSVVRRVSELIVEEGMPINGVKTCIQHLKQRGFKIGLATNSPAILIPVVMNKLGLEEAIDIFSSAEHEQCGKPNPAVYLTTAKKLEVNPANCLAVEDSKSGLIAAKEAGMKTVWLTANPTNPFPQIADFIINDYTQLYGCLKATN